MPTFPNLKILMRLAMLFAVVESLPAQTYAPPTNGDYGGMGPFIVFVDTLTNPVYPAGNGTNLVVSILHPNTTINPSLPTIFFAHGYTSPVGNAADYGALLTNLASQGYNVVFSPYEGGTVNATIPKRFDELTTGFEAAVTNYNLNTNQVGFAGHSYGGGFLPAVIQHEMMGLSDQPSLGQTNPGHFWGSSTAFFYSMAPGYAYSGAGQTGVSGSQTIIFPTNLNVIEQVFKDDTNIADPRLAIDIFYNVTTLNSQKDFLAVNGDNHGTPPQMANHFLPNSGSGETSTSLQAWAIFRHLDALAACTFTGNTNARVIALGHGAPAETYEGVWSDGTNVSPMDVTDIPSPSSYPAGPYTVQWSDPANPRNNFPLVSGPPQISNFQIVSSQALVTVTGLLIGHSYVAQTNLDLTSANWGALTNFVASQASQMFSNNVTATAEFWRILAP